MTSAEYKELLKSRKWQIVKSRITERDNHTCRSCYHYDNEDIQLNVHHLKYLPGHKPWEYSDDDLITLCKECHSIWHYIYNESPNAAKVFLVAKLHNDLIIERQQYDS
jgi:5-methylcytosine-specific restriction endonuclease McrA